MTKDDSDEKTENETPKQNDKSKNGENETVHKIKINGNAKENEHLTILQKVKKFFAFFTVEPYLLCYVLPSIITTVAVQKLNMEKACRADLSFSEVICENAVAGISNNLTTEALNGAQKFVADLAAWKQPLQSGVPAILILFLGAWSDRSGNRKVLMLMPLIGEFLSSFGIILATYKFVEWPLWVTGLFEAIPPAVCGGLSIALMGSYSYIADISTVESRTFRIGITAVIVTLGIPLASSISGVLTVSLGYYGVFGMAMVFYVIGFLYVVFRIRDVRRTKIEGKFIEKVAQFFHPKNVWETLSLVLVPRGKQFIKILLVVWAHIVIVGPIYAEGAVLFLYMLKKFQMNVTDFSLFSTYSTLVGLAGTTIAVTLFSKKMKMHDALLGIIATACKVTSSIVYALAPTRLWFYSGPLFDFFGNAATTAVRSLGTKVVDPEQVGRMSSLIGFVEAVVPVIYTPIYSKLYSRTLETFPGAFYLLGGIMTVPAIFIFIILYFMHKKEQRDKVTNPDEKEMHAYDNEVTSYNTAL